jgi:hypothetical protein
MKIKAISNIKSDFGLHQVGDEFDLGDNEALELIRLGVAAKVSDSIAPEADKKPDFYNMTVPERAAYATSLGLNPTGYGLQSDLIEAIRTTLQGQPVVTTPETPSVENTAADLTPEVAPVVEPVVETPVADDGIELDSSEDEPTPETETPTEDTTETVEETPSKTTK